MKTIHSVVFVTVGLVLAFGSALIDATKYPDIPPILLNLGLVSIAVVLVEYLWRVSGGHPIEQQVTSLSDQVSRLSEAVDIVDASKKIGLTHVYDSLANFGTQANWEQLINNAEVRVDLMCVDASNVLQGSHRTPAKLHDLSPSIQPPWGTSLYRCRQID